jgi:hypothetical protein
MSPRFFQLQPIQNLRYLGMMFCDALPLGVLARERLRDVGFSLCLASIF